MAINDDDLLPDLDHLGSVVDEVDGEETPPPENCAQFSHLCLRRTARR
jgi:hypothetical protein